MQPIQEQIKAKKIAYLMRQSPYGNDFSHDAIDALLAAGIYGQDVSVIFLNDGIFQLLEPKNYDDTQGKSISKKLNALAFYDIDKIYACETSMAQRNLNTHHFAIDVQTLNKETLGELLHTQDTLLSF